MEDRKDSVLSEMEKDMEKRKDDMLKKLGYENLTPEERERLIQDFDSNLDKIGSLLETEE